MNIYLAGIINPVKQRLQNRVAPDGFFSTLSVFQFHIKIFD